MRLTKLALTVVVLSLVCIVAAILLSTTVHIHNRGGIKAVGVAFYWDREATQNATEIDWGMLTPGSNNTAILFCKNIKNMPITLNLTVNNWSPINVSLYLHAGWNYTGAVIQVAEVIPIQFQLAVDANVTGIDTFSFDYTINAIEYT